MKNKNFINIYVLIFLGLSVANCSNDFEMFHEASPKPLVYCTINPADTFCFVTLTKSILDNGDPFELVKNVYNLEVNDVEITLEGWGKGFKMWETGFKKVPNPFDSNNSHEFSRPCYQSISTMLFADLTGRFCGNYKEFDFFRLVINSPELEKVVYSRIPVIDAPSDIAPIGSKKFTLYGDYKTLLHFKINLKKTKYIELVCYLHYNEMTDTLKEKRVLFHIRKDLQFFEEDVYIFFYEDEFFNKIAAAVKTDQEVDARFFKSFDLEFCVGDQSFDDYWSTYENASNIDNTSFGNITNGSGLFSIYRSVRTNDIEFDIQTMDSLCNGRFTKHLNFKSW